MNNSLVYEKAYKFAIRIVNAYKYLKKDKKEFTAYCNSIWYIKYKVFNHWLGWALPTLPKKIFCSFLLCKPLYFVETTAKNWHEYRSEYYRSKRGDFSSRFFSQDIMRNPFRKTPNKYLL